MAAFTGWSIDGANTMANSLSALGQQFGKAIETNGKREMYAALGADVAAGNYQGAAEKAFSALDPDTGIKILQMGKDAQGLAGLSQRLYGNNATLGGVTAPQQNVTGQPMNLTGGSGPSRGDLNNNSGNIEAGPYAKNQQGYVGSDGRFAKFDTPMHGFEAQTNLLGQYGRQGITTIDGIINKWAPPGENGSQSTANYIQTVSRELGVAPDTQLDLSDPNLRQTVARAMAAVEQGHPFSIPDGSAGSYAAGGHQQRNTQVAANYPSASANPGVANDGRGQNSNGVNQPVDWGAQLQYLLGVQQTKEYLGAPKEGREMVDKAISHALQMANYQQSVANNPANKMTAEQGVRRAYAQEQGWTGEKAARYIATGNVPSDADLMSPAQKQMSEQFGKDYSAYTESAKAANRTLAGGNRMLQLMNDPNFYSGPWANVAVKFKQAGALVGFDVANAASPMEAFQSLANSMVVDGLGGKLGAGVSNSDVSFLQSMSPNLALSKEGNRQLIEMKLEMAKRDIQIKKMASDYVQRNGALDARFESQLADWAEKNPMFAKWNTQNENDQRLRDRATETYPDNRQQQQPQQNSGQKTNLKPLRPGMAAEARDLMNRGYKREQVIQHLQNDGFDTRGL